MKRWTYSMSLSLLLYGTTLVAQTTAQRDQQALTVLSQAIAVGGGQDLLTAIQDCIGTGTVTYSTQDQVTGNVTIKGRGSIQFRLDADLSTGRRTTIASGSSGALVDVDGATYPIFTQSAADLENMILPYRPLLTALQDSSVSVFYVGLVSHNGATAYDIRIQKAYTAAQDPDGTRGPREAHDVFIDSSTFLIISTLDQIHFSRAGDDGVPHEILYSNYQMENGVAMPSTISETTYGVTGVTIQLTQVAFNSGLTDADFNW
jgi:hypothetical protein